MNLAVPLQFLKHITSKSISYNYIAIHPYSVTFNVTIEYKVIIIAQFFSFENVFFKVSVPFISSDPMFKSETTGFLLG